MLSVIILALSAAVPAAVALDSRAACPTPADYWNPDLYWAPAVTWQSNTDTFYWTGIDKTANTMETTTQLPSYFSSAWYKVDSKTASLGYDIAFVGGGAYAKPVQVGRPVEFYYPNDNYPGAYTTFNIIAQDCQLWLVANGTGAPAPDKRDVNSIWQFAADNDTFRVVSYEGPGSPNANAALRLQQIPVQQPKTKPLPTNDTRCLTVNNYFHSNRSNWQFGFQIKHDFFWYWLDFGEDFQNFVYYWSADFGIREDGEPLPRPDPWFNLRIENNHTMTSVPIEDQNNHRTHADTLGAPIGSIQTSEYYPPKYIEGAARVGLAVENCQLWVVKQGTEDKSIFQWGLQSKPGYVGWFGPGHPQANAAMFVIPIEPAKD